MERVVRNALVKVIAAMPPDYPHLRRLFLPSVRAGLAFSGEVDPPLTANRAFWGAQAASL
jgi:hypothetical protein